MNKKYKPKKEKKKKVTTEARDYKMNRQIGQASTKCRHCGKRVPLSAAWNCCWSNKYASAFDAAMGKHIELVKEEVNSVDPSGVDIQDGDS